MKKNILLSAISTLLFAPIFAQSPGGVSASSTNQFWLDANRLSLSDGSPVQTWTDRGQGGHAVAHFRGGHPIRPHRRLHQRPGNQSCYPCHHRRSS